MELTRDGGGGGEGQASVPDSKLPVISGPRVTKINKSCSHTTSYSVMCERQTRNKSL